MNERPETNAPAAVCVAIGLLLPVLYVVGYFVLPVYVIDRTPRERIRCYRGALLPAIYKPAAAVERAITGDDVQAITRPTEY